MNSLYVHIPFCEKKCFYCSFSISVGQQKRMRKYIQCLAKEMESTKKECLETLYVGGGTPSYLTNECIEMLCGILKEKYDLSNLKEFTFEMNPEDVDQAKIRMLTAAGVDRISLGAQSMNDKYLRFLGRNHSAKKIEEAFHVLRSQGVKNISLDLIYSIPGQTIKEIQEDVLKLCALKSEHLSLYSLTIEKNSRFFTKKVLLDSPEVRGAHYTKVCRLLAQEGFVQYEISNFCKPGFESLHNINYWTGGDYKGIGVSSHSHVYGRRSWNESKLFDYIKKIENGQSVIVGEEILSQDQRLSEVLLFGLRMNKGVNIKDLKQRFRIDFNVQQQYQIDQCIKEGYLCLENDRLFTTEKGRLVLDEISARLI